MLNGDAAASLTAPNFRHLCLFVSWRYGNFDGDAIVSFLTDLLNPERAGSIAFRFENEELLRAKAQERLLFGWGGWGRNLVYAENWQGEIENITVTDSLWILAFGINGIVGLSCWSTSLLLPVVCFCVQHCPARTWFNPKVAPAAVLAVCLTLFVLDCLLNAMLNPIFPLISGGLAGLVTEPNNEHLTQLYRLKKGNKVLSVLRL